MINFSILNEIQEDTDKAPFTAIEAMDTCYSEGNCREIVSCLNSSTDVHFVSNGNFSLHDIVNECVARLGKVHTMTLSTFSFTELPARMIGNWMEEGKVNKLYALLDVRSKANYPGVFQQLGQLAEALAIVPVHAKVTILESEHETITIIGSANWTTNPRYEVGQITTNKQTAAFHKAWIFKAINDKMKTNAIIQ